jgi:hypothetical protein
MTYFTQHYSDLNDARKIEVLVEQLIKIACYNDIDTEQVMTAINDIADLRSQVSSH